MPRKYNKRRKVQNLDKTDSKFYVYCLYWIDDATSGYADANVFYIGKAKNKEFPCLRRENKHLEEAFRKTHYDYHKSRKIRALLSDGKLISSKILQEFDTEYESYSGEIEWYEKFKKCGNDLTNMAECGLHAVGSGESHPSYDHEIRKHANDIKHLYVEECKSLAYISKRYNKSMKLIKQILHSENVTIRDRHITNSKLWRSKDELIKKYESGFSLNKLSKEYGFSINAISSMFRVENIPIRKHPKRSKAWNHSNDIREMHTSGISKQKICNKYDCDISVINSILNTNE